MKVDEQPIPRFIPMNVVDSGRCLNGLVKTRNLVEALLITIPIFFLCLKLIPNTNIPTKISYMSILVGTPFIGAIIGIPPYSLVEAIKLLLNFKKTNHFAFYNPRLKWETTPDFLVQALEVPVMKQLANSFEILFGSGNTERKRESAITNIENCTNEIHYKEDESKSEWTRAQHKAKKLAIKAEKAQHKADIAAAKKAEKDRRKAEKIKAKHREKE